jgi:hypothetical protein
MKRIIGTVVAIAGVLAFSTLASAAPYVFNVTGTGNTTTSTTLTPGTSVPSSYLCPTAAGNCITTPFSAGSSITVDITGTDATITASVLNINTSLNIFGGAILLSTNVVATVLGGLGTLTGDDIVWTAPASYTVAGTFTCAGACGAASLPVGTYPISALFNATTNPVNPIGLGTWDLDAALANILGSTRAVTSTAKSNGSRASWLNFGPTDMGNIVPEPGSAALVLLGLGALALRSRKA